MLGHEKAGLIDRVRANHELVIDDRDGRRRWDSPARARWIGETDGEEPNGKAMAILSTMVGALILSRTVNDERLSKQFLQAAADSVQTTLSADGRASSKRDPAQRKKRRP